MRALTQTYTLNVEDEVVGRLYRELRRELTPIFEKFYDNCKSNEVYPDVIAYLLTSTAHELSTSIMCDKGFDEMKRLWDEENTMK